MRRCEHCGQPLPDGASRARRFCGHRCITAARCTDRRRALTCPVCGAQKQVQDLRPQTYCSHACVNKATAAARSKPRASQWRHHV